MMYLLVLISSITKSLPIIILLTILFKEKLRISLNLHVSILMIFTILTSFVSYYFMINEYLTGMYSIFYSFIYIMAFILLFTFSLEKKKNRIFKLFFTIFILRNIIDGFILIGHIIIFSFHEIPNNLFFEHFFLFFKGSAIMVEFFAILLAMPFLYYLINNHLRYIVNATESLSFWYYLWLAPASLYAISRFIIWPGYQEALITPIYFGLYLFPLWLVSCFSIFLLILKMLLHLSKSILLQQELKSINMHMDMQKKHYESLQIIMDEVKKMQHDKRHRLLYLQSLAKDKDFETMEKFLKTNITQLENFNITFGKDISCKQ